MKNPVGLLNNHFFYEDVNNTENMENTNTISMYYSVISENFDFPLHRLLYCNTKIINRISM